MNCKICNSPTSTLFNAKILNKYSVDYFACKQCGFVSTEKPYWLADAYDSSINASDTGIMQRNIQLSRILTLLIFFLFDRKAKFLDYAGGYGILTRLMRDVGFDFYWSDQFSGNLLSYGFEAVDDDQYELTTCIEAFEHFVEPMDEIETLFEKSDNVFFTTECLPQPVPAPEQWWYYGLEHGQHIAFYSTKTLQKIADQYNVHYCHYNSLHLFTKRKISPLLLKWLVRMSRLPMISLISLFMESKTLTDSNKLLSMDSSKSNDSD